MAKITIETSAGKTKELDIETPFTHDYQQNATQGARLDPVQTQCDMYFLKINIYFPFLIICFKCSLVITLHILPKPNLHYHDAYHACKYKLRNISYLSHVFMDF